MTNCSWMVKGGKAKADFNIYQARNGGVYLLIGSKVTELSLEQIKELSIDVYGLINFDYDLFKKRYLIGA